MDLSRRRVFQIGAAAAAAAALPALPVHSGQAIPLASASGKLAPAASPPLARFWVNFLDAAGNILERRLQAADIVGRHDHIEIHVASDIVLTANDFEGAAAISVTCEFPPFDHEVTCFRARPIELHDGQTLTIAFPLMVS